MHKIKNKNVPHIFLKLFDVPCHVYLTNFSLINFSVPQTFLKTTRFAISARGPLLWNNCLPKEEKEIDNILLFKKRAKEKIIELSTAGPVWKLVNTWPKKMYAIPFQKLVLLISLYPEFLEKKNKEIKKSWFLVNSRCFCFAFHANLTSDGKNKRLKFLFITLLIWLINMSISLFRWTV